MYHMVEGAKRGGMCQVSCRYGKANNKYMKEYDPSKKSKYLMYLDANNLYGWAMSFMLPLDGFEWHEGLTEEDVRNYDDKGDVGYLVECDLEYPKDLHDLHNDYPLGPT
jgi:hypothetical protein